MEEKKYLGETKIRKEFLDMTAKNAPLKECNKKLTSLNLKFFSLQKTLSSV